MAFSSSAVFICYRRDDTADVAGRIYDELTNQLGSRRVFKDVDNLKPGIEFGQEIKRVIPQCRIALILIGPHWLASSDEDGTPRIRNANDWVRIEIETSLSAANIEVIPVLVNGAQMPDFKQLPPSLQGLMDRHAAVVRRDPDFRVDIRRLLRTIRVSLKKRSIDQIDLRSSRTRSNRLLRSTTITLAAVSVLAVSVAVATRLDGSVAEWFSLETLLQTESGSSNATDATFIGEKKQCLATFYKRYVQERQSISFDATSFSPLVREAVARARRAQARASQRSPDLIESACNGRFSYSPNLGLEAATPSVKDVDFEWSGTEFLHMYYLNYPKAYPAEMGFQIHSESDGTKFLGRVAVGRMVNAETRVYEGRFAELEDKTIRFISGSVQLSDGDVYLGDQGYDGSRRFWVGDSIFIGTDGFIHEGEWSAEGAILHGVDRYPDGTRYEGQFKLLHVTGFDKVKHGVGVLWGSEGQILQHGAWIDGVFDHQISNQSD